MRTGYASDTWTGCDPRGFAHWLRTGIVPPEPDEQAEAELKFNPYHDPANGRFTFATGLAAGLRSILIQLVAQQRRNAGRLA